MKIITKDFSHIRDLTLDIDSTLLLEEWTSPALALHKLCINNWGPCTPLTMMFFSYIPQLESLTLPGFTRCPAGFLGSLKHLALKLPLTHPPIQITTIVDFLAAAPNIEALSQTSFLFMIDNSLPSFKAAFPQLQNLLLQRCDTLSILPHIFIPREAELHILVDYCALGFGISLPPADHHILLILPSLLKAYLLLPTSPKLIIEVDKTLSGFAITLTSTDSRNLHLKLSECSGQAPLGFMQRSLEAIPCHMYLRTTRNITTSIPPIISSIAWSSWLERFAFATQLSIRALPAELVLGTLMRTNGDSLLVCPSLRHV